MLAVQFSGRSGVSRCHQGELGAIYAVSSSLRNAQQSDDLAIYHGGFWHSVSSAEAYDRLTIDQPCLVRFEQFPAGHGEELCLGPFAGAIIAGGVIKTSGHKPQHLAIFDESLEQWRAWDGSVWPVVVIESSTTADTSAAETSSSLTVK